MIEAKEIYRRVLKYYRNGRLYVNNAGFYSDAEFEESIGDLKFNDILDYNSLTEYIYKCYSSRAIIGNTRIKTVGLASRNGNDIDSIEGVSRFLPIISSYLNYMHGSADDEKECFNEMLTFVRESIVNGTTKGDYYWGDHLDYDQLICEASDIAISLWISKPFIWDRLNNFEKENVCNWLKSATEKDVSQNNWIIFQLTIEAVLYNFGFLDSIDKNKYEKISGFQVEPGWFKDGNDGGIDYYNAWGFNYGLFWLNRISGGDLDPGLESMVSDTFQKYQYFFDSSGRLPYFGRSVSYRLAAICPLITYFSLKASKRDKDRISSLLPNFFKYHFKNGILKNGTITQGFITDSKQVVDDYSGPNSALWSLRALVLIYTLHSDGDEIITKTSGVFHEDQLGKVSVRVGSEFSVINDTKNNSVKINFTKKTEEKKGKKNYVSSFVKFLIYRRFVRKSIYPELSELTISSDNYFYRKLK
ncbi:hypothetical protein A1OO_20370 [Enterovibrio norvegicus FF-33]|uniref:DUF2264 domain-containing protein n=1 Tax=Enterovibrio norvegicus TaxID=188144 RepID=UPI0003187A85|nr:DUF2264 domain-containing protein [Enterovibrio norvegicus]OEE68086.1 hypothetical protein A1OO_20370 [Enterovibrio norvegicus FF-33]